MSEKPCNCCYCREKRKTEELRALRLRQLRDFVKGKPAPEREKDA